MPDRTTTIAVALWHFQCPECGFGDRETGYHAEADTLWCDVCLEDGRYVRLRRWPVDDLGLPPGRTSRRP